MEMELNFGGDGILRFVYLKGFQYFFELKGLNGVKRKCKFEFIAFIDKISIFFLRLFKRTPVRIQIVIFIDTLGIIWFLLKL